MQRYFLDDLYENTDNIKLTGEDFHHAIHVMRMTPGSQCYVSFADEVTVVAELQSVSDDTAFLTEVSKEEMKKELPCQVTIACGYTKGDKLELVAQKGTELGMAELIGFPAQTSVVKWDGKKLAKKEQRLSKICKEAAEQSHRQQQPKVKLLDTFAKLLKLAVSYDKVLVAYEESAKTGEKSAFVEALTTCRPGQRVLVIFGPEGGIAPREIEQLMQRNGTLCGLGPRILRAETAPLYVLAAMSYQWELLG
ncbi:16S rRNA (uracil(1498)-N(3))-methyltransferase [Vagococcus vulneris]|uniref:Ribosomal RNA small subunit methyltransferase E n=1 Tax=Vagococcus vulneris TaxID=1977869 RepID=A0A430A0B8_9ENTE|nr:16S rRNA (uracil(1498)-N(3))-methyltransferase [Vagococcus vulneris]RST99757.1 16S rRNA (uracil(1498)-N(3))-methyltransferase [Vagococcus vulneris]